MYCSIKAFFCAAGVVLFLICSCKVFASSILLKRAWFLSENWDKNPDFASSILHQLDNAKVFSLSKKSKPESSFPFSSSTDPISSVALVPLNKFSKLFWLQDFKSSVLKSLFQRLSFALKIFLSLSIILFSSHERLKFRFTILLKILLSGHPLFLAEAKDQEIWIQTCSNLLFSRLIRFSFEENWDKTASYLFLISDWS